MYYFFLGKYLASNSSTSAAIIDAMCEDSHHESNHLTLLFTIHHARDNQIIENILLRTMFTLDSVPSATLTPEETKKFDSILRGLPESILSNDSVDTQRGKEREYMDNAAHIEEQSDEELLKDETSPATEIYRIMRNNRIMGQILRNRYGNLKKSQISEIVEEVSQSGLRLVNFLLKDDKEISRHARSMKAQFPDWEMPKIKEMLTATSFVWTMVNIEQVVDAINIPDIREVIDAMVTAKSLPAYDLIGYFNQLDTAMELTNKEHDRLQTLLKRHDDIFIQRVLSIRTQYYMNTHRSSAMTEQSICSLLDIKYLPRVLM